MAFKYIAYNADSKVVKGIIDVNQEELAKDALRRSGYRVLNLKPARQRLSLRRQLPSLFGVKTQDIIAFSRHLATLISRGTTTLAALELLRDETSNITFKEVIDDISHDIRQGRSLSDAMSKHPDVFSTLYCRMVEVSEQTGSLEDVLVQLAEHMEKERALLSKAARAFAYPAFILMIAAGVVTILVMFTLPSLTESLVDLESGTPLPTRILVAITDFASSYKLALLGAALGMGVFAALAVKQPVIRHKLDALMLKMPLIGPVVIMREMAHFNRLLSTCLSVSLRMPEIMQLAINTSRNRVVAEALEDIRSNIMKGRGLSQPMAENPLFPRLMVQMVKVGEKAGTLDEDLKSIAVIYEAEVDKRVQTVISLIEPALMVFLGLIVGFIVISIILPIYSVLGEVGEA